MTSEFSSSPSLEKNADFFLFAMFFFFVFVKSPCLKFVSIELLLICGSLLCLCVIDYR